MRVIYKVYNEICQINNNDQLIGLVIRNQRKNTLGYSLLWNKNKENVMKALL